MCHRHNLLGRHLRLLVVAEATTHLNHLVKHQEEGEIQTLHHLRARPTREEDVEIILIASTIPTVSHNALVEDAVEDRQDPVPTIETTSSQNSLGDSREDAEVEEPEGDKEGTKRMIQRCQATTGT